MNDFLTLAKEVADTYHSIAGFLKNPDESADAEGKAKRYDAIANGADTSKTSQELWAEREKARKKLTDISNNTSGHRNTTQTNSGGGDILNTGKGDNNEKSNVLKDIHIRTQGSVSISQQIVNNLTHWPNWLLLSGSGIAIISTFLPWVVQQEMLNSFYTLKNMNSLGTQTIGGGIAIVLGFLVAGLSIAPIDNKPKANIAGIASLLMILGAGLSFGLSYADVSNRLSQMDSLVNRYQPSNVALPSPLDVISVGPGIIAVVIAAVIIFAGGVSLQSIKSQSSYSIRQSIS